ncbi:MAG: hypothetical protein GX202_03745 [Firmicutes bacterium]|nr:hypothetical protein [Bacillota bacterium]
MIKPAPRRVLLFLTAAFVFMLLGAQTVQGVARVEPSKFVFTLEPGTRITDAIKVTNTQDTEVEFTAVVYDWTLDPQGRLVTFSAGERPDTLDGLIKFNPRRFKLAPGQSQYVRFTITAPKNGNWLERRGIIFFEESRPSPETVGSTMIFQVGTTVYLSFTETLYSFRLLGVKIEPTPQGRPVALLGLANDGQAHIRYQVAYEITGEDGTPSTAWTSGEQLILPDSQCLLTVPIETELPPGNYQLSVRLSFSGTTQTLSSVVPFTIP